MVDDELVKDEKTPELGADGDEGAVRVSSDPGKDLVTVIAVDRMTVETRGPVPVEIGTELFPLAEGETEMLAELMTDAVTGEFGVDVAAVLELENKPEELAAVPEGEELGPVKVMVLVGVTVIPEERVWVRVMILVERPVLRGILPDEDAGELEFELGPVEEVDTEGVCVTVIVTVSSLCE